jgi:hypothetical protein
LLVAILASGISYIDDFIFAWRRTRLYGSYELHILLGVIKDAFAAAPRQLDDLAKQS